MNNLSYGVIGNCKTAALISDKGSIDWCCLPDFDSSSVFASLLDKKKGGKFAIEPVGEHKIEQEYIEKTNLLMTRFKGKSWSFDVIDFMPRSKRENGYHCPPDLIRYIRVNRGKPKVKFVYDVRPGYAMSNPATEIHPDCIKSMSTDGAYESIYLYTNLSFDDIIKPKPVELKGESYFLMSYNQKITSPTMDKIKLELETTKVYWMNWVAKTKVPSEYADTVERSALVLKLLAYQESGAILAAITTSLPETIGEVRNWDYRFCWIRDASMTISVMTRLGHYNVAKRFLRFILGIVPYKNEKVQIMYGIRGQKKLTEKELPWLEGYEKSAPVRIGNAAYHQKQNDIYGVLMDVIYQSFVIFGNTLDIQEELWTVVRGLVRHVRKNWSRADKGIWEFRSEKRHFVFSKILCWVAMDRAVKIARIIGKDGYADKWSDLRDKIKEDVRRKGYSDKIKALRQSYGEDHLDAANLLAEHYGFMEASDPMFINTVEQTYSKLSRDGLMYRYINPDDFGVPSSSFTVCTFWMIKSLWQIGERDLAKKMFDNILKHRNHLGLLSEDIDFKTKRLLGNFPQGYSHLALVDVAMTMCDKLNVTYEV